MNVKKTLEDYPLDEVAILQHGYTPCMRDYFFLVQVSEKVWQHPGGFYLFTFSHCPVVNVRTAIRDDTWKRSWSPEYTDWKEWESQGAPPGFVWGVCWAEAYPGLEYVENSELARHWSQRLGHPMHEIVVETNVYRVQLVFHDVTVRQVEDGLKLIDESTFRSE